jgi:hypothetical protein
MIGGLDREGRLRLAGGVVDGHIGAAQANTIYFTLEQAPAFARLPKGKLDARGAAINCQNTR